MDAPVAFDCVQTLVAATYSLVATGRPAAIGGRIEMPPLDRSELCFDQQPGAYWYVVEETSTVEGTGRNARLPLTIATGSASQSSKLTSIGPRDSGAFVLHPPPLPIDIGTLAPGAAPQEVRVPIRLSVADCRRARAFAVDDLRVAIGVSPDERPDDQSLAIEGSRQFVLGVTRLVDSTCG